MNRCQQGPGTVVRMTKGKATLIQKDPIKETAPENHRPITGLQMMWRILTEEIREEIYNSLTIFTNPSARVGYDTRSIFKRSLTGLNSVFSFSETSCLTKAEEPSLPYYLPIAGGRIIGFIPFQLANKPRMVP